VRITPVHGPDGGSYPHVRIWETRPSPASSAKAGFYALPRPASALHPSLLSINRSGQTTLLLSLTGRLTGRIRPHLFSPIDGRANGPLTLSSTIKKVLD